MIVMNSDYHNCNQCLEGHKSLGLSLSLMLSLSLPFVSDMWRPTPWPTSWPTLWLTPRAKADPITDPMTDLIINFMSYHMTDLSANLMTNLMIVPMTNQNCQASFALFFDVLHKSDRHDGGIFGISKEEFDEFKEEHATIRVYKYLMCNKPNSPNGVLAKYRCLQRSKHRYLEATKAELHKRNSSLRCILSHLQQFLHLTNSWKHVVWGTWRQKKVLGDGPHKQRDRSDAVRLSCQWRIHTCSYGKLVKVGNSCFSLSSMPFLFPCSERVCPCLLILQLESISTTCPGDRKAQAVSLEKNLSWSWLFGQGGLQKNNQCQLVLAWRKEPYIVFRCGSIS